MKPPRFDYYRPTTLDEALELLDRFRGDAAVLAGGQSLVPMMNMRLALPSVLVDINRIGDLSGIRRENGVFVLGALTRHREIERSEELREGQPALPEAVSHIGHVTIRNRGTIGGSLAHADPASEVATVGLALGMEVLVKSAQGERRVPLDEFFLGTFSSAIQEGELLTEARVPARLPGQGIAFLELARTHGNFAVAAACTSLTLTDGAVSDARVALGGVGPTALRSREAENVLKGREPGADAFRDAATAVGASLAPTSDVQATAEYRRQVASVLVRRALEQAAARARED